MSPRNYLEIDFEEHIEEQLHESGYRSVEPTQYDKQLCLIPDEVIVFVKETQPKEYEKLKIQYGADTESKLNKRICTEIENRGVIDVLRNGVKDRGCHFTLCYFQPKSGLNLEHAKLYKSNRFVTVRQLKYSKHNECSIDMGIFLNGIPIVMLELKNSLTGQNHTNAIKQWMYDRKSTEALFRFKRNLVYFAVGNEKCSMTTRLSGSKTRFLPFNRGIENPINPDGHKTHYLWDEVLQENSVLDLVESFVHIRTETEKVFDAKKGRVVDKKKDVLIFPRYHQLKVVRRLKQDVIEKGAGHNYLIQHTTGSGKSLSIAWLSHLLSSIYQSKEDYNRIFDSVIVVTDRRVLDKQIQETIKQLEQTKGVVCAVDKDSRQLKEYIESGKSIIITTIQKFPFISKKVADMKDKKFAIIIDEVHSSQSGETAKHLKMTLTDKNLDEFSEDEGSVDLTEVDKKILSEIESRGKQKHISYFGFSGTPKNKTLELFGTNDGDGFKPFDLYSMKQSIAEGFTLDVLKNYTTYKRYFKLDKTIKEDIELPESRVKSLLTRWVDIHPHSIAEKTQIILEHFINHTANKIVGKGRGMLVTHSRLHCVKYKLEFDKQMKEMKLPYRALVGFSGMVWDKDSHQEYTETSMNGFSEKQTGESLKDPKFRMLIVNNKFQTGFDESMLHTMYVDKKFGGLQCVQTLSRLNRTMSGKTDTLVLDFVNEPEEVKEAFQPYYEGTVLTDETDPNRLYQIEQEVKQYNFFQDDLVERYANIFYDKSIPMEELQGVLDSVVPVWSEADEDEQEEFRGHLQSFLRLYSYIAQIISFTDVGLEKLHIFLCGLNKKLPRRETEQLSDILSYVDLEYFRLQKIYDKAVIPLESGDDTLDGIGDGGGSKPDDEPTDFLSVIINTLNDSYDGDFSESDLVRFKLIQQGIQKYPGLKEVMLGDNSEDNKRSVFDRAMEKVLVTLVGEHLDFYNKVKEPERNKFVNQKMYKNYCELLAE